MKSIIFRLPKSSSPMESDNNILTRLQQQWREIGFCGKSGYYLYTGISFGLCLLLVIKFFRFDRTFRCYDSVCEFEMLLVLFSLGYSTIHLFALLFGENLIQKMSSTSRGATPLALVCGGNAFLIIFLMAFVLTIYAASTFHDRWAEAAFYCFCWVLQPTFTLLAIYIDYTSLMISPRLSTALIQQWIERLCEVETQNEPIEMRRTVREVLQHMNSMINY